MIRNPLINRQKNAVPTYRLCIEYDGSDFHGWQIQPDQPTVQAALEAALAQVTRWAPSVVGSGRTDAGVHARGQVAHIVLPETVDPFRLCGALNGVLPNSVAVRTVEAVPEGFHARYDARRRRYHYYGSTVLRPLERNHRVLLRPAPDVALMNRAAENLLGRHDFDAFCRVRSETENRVCTVAEARWIEEERPGDLYFRIAANRFLHGMVRAIVGTLLEVGRGKRPPDDLVRVLRTRDRRVAGPAAPAAGLVLEAVTYPEPG